MISSFINIEVVFCTLIICASGYYFLKPSKKHGKNTEKTVLITGCDSGFGKGLVICAANAGFKVIAACYSEQGAKEFDDDPEITAYIQVKDLNISDNEKVYIFNGWTFSSSPTLNPFDHPVYDLWLSSCKII